MWLGFDENSVIFPGMQMVFSLISHLSEDRRQREKDHMSLLKQLTFLCRPYAHNLIQTQLPSRICERTPYHAILNT